MANVHSESLRRLKPALELRGRLLQSLRHYFYERNFLEIETPVRIPVPALELHIDAEPAGDCFLRTSPELYMKRLLAAGCERIFQMGPCFRRGEKGPRHHPEYTMLEWYRTPADYNDILADTRELIVSAARNVLGTTDLIYQGQKVSLGSEWRRITVSEAFLKWAGWDPAKAFDADRFDLDLVEKVEPGLPRNVPVVLSDYPAEAAALARRKKDNPRVAERWELFIAGMEIANAYSELTDAAEQLARFEECAAKRKELGKEVYPIDPLFIEALKSGLPPSGGIALGVDRLTMLLADAPSIDGVVAFRE